MASIAASASVSITNPVAAVVSAPLPPATLTLSADQPQVLMEVSPAPGALSGRVHTTSEGPENVSGQRANALAQDLFQTPTSKKPKDDDIDMVIVKKVEVAPPQINSRFPQLCVAIPPDPRWVKIEQSEDSPFSLPKSFKSSFNHPFSLSTVLDTESSLKPNPLFVRRDSHLERAAARAFDCKKVDLPERKAAKKAETAQSLPKIPHSSRRLTYNTGKTPSAEQWNFLIASAGYKRPPLPANGILPPLSSSNASSHKA